MTNILALDGISGLKQASWLRQFAFDSTPPIRDLEKEEEKWGSFFELSDGYLAIQDGQTVACAFDVAFEQQIRGTILPMAGIGSVAVHPEYRRQGFAKLTLSRLFQGAKERGAVVSCLFPFLESFYERMGYVSFPYRLSMSFPVEKLQALLKMPMSGRVRLLSLQKDYETYRRFTRKYFEQTHGFAWKEEGWWDRKHRDRNSFWLATAESATGEIVGMMPYQSVGMQDRLVAERMFYLNQEGKYLLLNWLARYMGQAGQIQLNLPASGLEAPFLPNLNPKISAITPPMGRVLQFSALQGLKVGAGTCRISITDPLCPWQEGAYELSAGLDHRLHIKPIPTSSNQLKAQAISALIYGTHDPAEFSFRGWGTLDASAIQDLRDLFPRQSPYLHEEF
ncbi:MAG: GNAT family N-acetyltransferase [Bacteroidota bacterium]